MENSKGEGVMYRGLANPSQRSKEISGRENKESH